MFLTELHFKNKAISISNVWSLSPGGGFSPILSYIWHIHKWSPCNFENFKMASIKERIEYEERLCRSESLCIILIFNEKLYRHLNSG